MKIKVQSSSWWDNAHRKTQIRIDRVISEIESEYDFIEIVDVDLQKAEGPFGGKHSVELIFSIESNIPELNSITLNIKFNRPFDQVKNGAILKEFKSELNDYIRFRDINLTAIKNN